MVNLMLDELAAAADIVAEDATSIGEFLYEEAEATAVFLMQVAAWMESVWYRATAAVAEL